MINPVSFTGTYRVNVDSSKSVDTIKVLNTIQNCLCTESVTKPYINEKGKPYMEFTFSLPKKEEYQTETLLKYIGVDFKRIDKEMTSKESIQERVTLPESDKTLSLRMLNAEKLEEFLDGQEFNNIEENKFTYMLSKDFTDFFLRTEEKFSAPVMEIVPYGYDDDGEMLSAKTIADGKNFDKNSIYIELGTNSNNTEGISLYMAMKEAGLKQIPVAVDDDTYKMGQALGFFE